MPGRSGQSGEADPSESSRIFISYRRDDSAGHVLALLPALRNHFGADRIFKDTESIPVGEDYREFIKRVLTTCSVMLAIIGRDWLTIQDAKLKTRRLDNPDDPLRLEVTTALKNERIRVIPVLVDRGVMPNREDLPDDLAALHFRNALELSDTRWESDVQRLIQAIEEASPTPVQRTRAQSRLRSGVCKPLEPSCLSSTHESHPIELIPTDPASLTFTGRAPQAPCGSLRESVSDVSGSGDDGPVPAWTESRERGGAGEQVELRHIRAGADAGTPPAFFSGSLPPRAPRNQTTRSSPSCRSSSAWPWRRRDPSWRQLSRAPAFPSTWRYGASGWQGARSVSAGSTCERMQGRHTARDFSSVPISSSRTIMSSLRRSPTGRAGAPQRVRQRIPPP